jgi:preprotein translocase subunit SecG
MLQTILFVVMILIGLALTGVVLLQRSEGGALGMGGGPSGFMTARGAGNLLTVATWWLGLAFGLCAVSLTIVGNMQRNTGSIVGAGDIGAIDLDAQPAPGAAPAGDPATAPPPAAPVAPSLDDLEAVLPSAAAPAPTPASPAQ